jgi:hypothetical protein
MGLPTDDEKGLAGSPMPGESQLSALRLSPADRAKHESKMQSPVALQGAQKFRSYLCADDMDAPICIPSSDYVAGGPTLHAEDSRVKARHVPSARFVVVPQDEIHDVGLAVEQPEQTHPK